MGEVRSHSNYPFCLLYKVKSACNGFRTDLQIDFLNRFLKSKKYFSVHNPMYLCIYHPTHNSDSAVYV